jgi:hypothetical protein
MASRDGRGGSNKGFWGGMFRTRERFSLEELTHLYETLVKHPVVTDSNKVRSVQLGVHLKSPATQHTPRIRTSGLCEPRRWARDRIPRNVVARSHTGRRLEARAVCHSHWECCVRRHTAVVPTPSDVTVGAGGSGATAGGSCGDAAVHRGVDDLGRPA